MSKKEITEYSANNRQNVVFFNQCYKRSTFSEKEQMT